MLTNRPSFFVSTMLVIVIFGLKACAPVVSVPIVERPQPPTERINHHWVASGETLYAIAWRYNMDPVALASANGIRKPYRIYSGQRLRLDGGKAQTRRASPTSASQPANTVSRPRPVPRREQIANLAGTWQWPTQGQLKRRYTTRANDVHNGLDIDGVEGQPIRAANAGTVVYAGDGLPAYGKLLIIKHDDIYLSAYAHNRRLIVKEGQQIKTGQKIAEMGKTGTTFEHLHFEVRKKGIPIDPLSVLPRKAG